MQKKFILYTLATSIGALLIFSYIVQNFKMLYMNREYPMMVHIKKFLNSNHNLNTDIILIGDSRAKAGWIPNNAVSGKNVSLTISGSTPIEGYYILKNLILNNNIPDNLILSYSPYLIAGHSSYWTSTVKFDFLKSEEYIEIEAQAQILNDHSTLGEGITYTDYYYPVHYRNNFLKGISKLRWRQNKKILDHIELSNGHYFYGKEDFADWLNDEASLRLFKPSILINYYFDELLKLAKKKEIRTYFYTMPFNEASYIASTEVFKVEFNKYIENKTKKFNVHNCNHLYWLPNYDFGDASHLYKGAKNVTKDVFRCVSQKR